MSLRQLAAAALFLISASAMAAQSFDINLNHNTAMLTYMTPLGQQGFGHGQAEGSILFTDGNNYLADVGFGVVGQAGTGSPGLIAGVGVKFYSLTTQHDNVAALALNGNFDFAPPAVPRLHFSGALNLAPDVVTFIDGNRLYFGDVEVGYEIFRDAIAYFGVRRIQVGIKGSGDYTLSDGGYIGVRFRF
jgi:hypothetical protein